MILPIAMKNILLVILISAMLNSSANLCAQQSGDNRSMLLTLLKNDQILDENVKQVLTKDLKDPDVLNEVLAGLKSKSLGPAGNLSGLAGVLSALNVKFKAFETKGSSDTSLGVTYSLERSLKEHELDASVGYPMSLSFTVHAKGNVAFDKSLNPDDFLDTGLSFDVFASKGGFEPLVDKDADAWAAQVQALNLEAAKFKGTPEELDASPVWHKIDSMVGGLFDEGRELAIGPSIGTGQSVAHPVLTVEPPLENHPGRLSTAEIVKHAIRSSHVWKG